MRAALSNSLGILSAMAGLAVVYGLLAVIGLNWAMLGGAGSPVWPASGVALAGLLIGGTRLWPAIFVGRLAAGLITGSTQPLWVELALASANVVGTVAAALAISRLFRLDLRLIAMRDVLWLAAAAAVGGALSGVVGVSALAAANGLDGGRAAAVGLNWWFGHFVGAITVAPLILAWRDRRDEPTSRGQRLHLAVVVLAVMALAWLVFLTPQTWPLRTWHIFPVLIWAALAFQVRGAALALVIASVAATLGTTLGLGPFVEIADTAGERAFQAQQFGAITSLTILILAAVADERRGKEALAALNADLEQRVREGATRLAQLQKTESLGQLTGGIAHDFNNLLMAIQSSLELVRKRLPAHDERALRLLDNALEGARRGAGLTQRLLAFARRQELRPEPVRIPDLIAGLADLLRRSLGPQVGLETRLPPGLPKAMVDANQLELAILNLALNARDAMPDGGALTIAVDEALVGEGSGLPAGRYLSIAVRDEGAGMDEDTLRRATEPFFTTKGVGKGTGLGLSMVQGLVEQSGGRLSLRSERGRGTTAEILLPAAESVRSGVPETETPQRRPAASSQGRALTVLVVDDDALVRMGASDMAQDLGHVVIEAGSGPEALALLRGGARVDVVLTDHAMPGMTGAQLAVSLRAERPGLPVILASGYAELPAEVDGLVAARLPKPFRQDELARVLSRVASRTETVAPLGAVES